MAFSGVTALSSRASVRRYRPMSRSTLLSTAAPTSTPCFSAETRIGAGADDLVLVAFVAASSPLEQAANSVVPTTNAIPARVRLATRVLRGLAVCRSFPASVHEHVGPTHVGGQR